MATQIVQAVDSALDAATAGDSFYVESGGFPVTGNVDYSSANRSVLMDVCRGYIGQLATSAAMLRMAFSTGLFYDAGGGDMWWESDSLDSDVTALVYHTGKGHLHVVGATGTITRYEASSGGTTIGNAVTLTTARFDGGAEATILDGGTGPTITLLEVGGGNVISQRPHTTATITGGKLTLDADSAGEVNAQGTINLSTGGTLILKNTGTITAFNWKGGTLEVPSGRPVTITDCSVNMTLPGASAFLDLATHGKIVFTNTPTRLFAPAGPI